MKTLDCIQIRFEYAMSIKNQYKYGTCNIEVLRYIFACQSAIKIWTLHIDV